MSRICQSTGNVLSQLSKELANAFADFAIAANKIHTEFPL